MGSVITPEPELSDSPYIRFVHVYKSFQHTPVLEDVNFEVRRGEMMVVMGKSGVGKSVTLKHILGFLQPDAGEVFVAGREVSKMREEELSAIRRKVTMVFQSGALFDSLTVGENVAYPLRERAERGLALDESNIQEQVAELLEALSTTQRYAHLAPDAHGKVIESWSRRPDASVTHDSKKGRSS